MTSKAVAPAVANDPFLVYSRERVERALDRFLPPVTASPQRLHEAMRYATLNGGKRIRACFVYAAGQALSAIDAALDAPAAAVELVHAYSLVHDDMPCMDDDDLRRGKPTCHRAYDEATALLVGDALQALAFEVLVTDPAGGLSDAQRVQMVATLVEGINSTGMAGGQAIDLAAVGKTLTLPELENMHRRKTGALIRASILLGACAASAIDPARLAALDAYARAVGLAFQIADDILDVEASTEVLGKTAGADQARNKPTYPSVMGLAAAKGKAQELYTAALESLRPLGDNAAPLAYLARYTIARSQ